MESGDEFSNPVGSGPYTFVEWVSGDKITLKKNENYFDADNMGQMDTITFKVIPEGTSRTIALETGEVDVVDELPSNDVSKVEDASDLTMYSSASTRIDYLGMNTQMAPFDNKLVRQAFNYAVDKQAVMMVAIDAQVLQQNQSLHHLCLVTRHLNTSMIQKKLRNCLQKRDTQMVLNSLFGHQVTRESEWQRSFRPT